MFIFHSGRPLVCLLVDHVVKTWRQSHGDGEWVAKTCFRKTIEEMFFCQSLPKGLVINFVK